MGKQQNSKETCPCGSGMNYLKCCGNYHSAANLAPTAEKLMRSRYAAYVNEDVDYLKKTWCPNFCPSPLQVEKTQWIGLKILSTEKGRETDTEGWVEFVARYKEGGRAYKIQERSYFEKRDGQWLYVKAENLDDA